MAIQAFKALLIALLKLLAICFAWCCKIIGIIFLKISEITLKFVSK
jgi:hypothetical protein